MSSPVNPLFEQIRRAYERLAANPGYGPAPGGGHNPPVTLEVRRLRAQLPVDCELLSDEGIPCPNPAHVHVPVRPLSWRRRMYWRLYDRWWKVRRRVGYWIAGEDPDGGRL